MNAEHQALAEYLEARFDKQFDKIKDQLKEVNRNIYNLTLHVDRKNDQQDEEFGDKLAEHEYRISALESDFRIITS